MKTNELPAHDEFERSLDELIRQLERTSNNHRRDGISPRKSRFLAGRASEAQQEIVAWIGIIAIVAITFFAMWLKAGGWQNTG